MPPRPVAAFLAAAVTLSPLAAAPLAAQQGGPVPPMMQPIPAVLSSGRAEVKVAPDRATVMVSVETRAATAAGAGSANATRSKATLDALRKLGLAPDQLTTAGYNVYPEMRYDGEGKAPRVVGYVARNTVRAELRKIDDVGRAIDAALGAGATSISGVNFTATTTDAARRTAIADAVRMACRDADVIAQAAGMRLGQPLEMSADAQMPGPRPMYEMAMQRGAAAADATEINPADLTISANVSARWRLVSGSAAATSADVMVCR